MLIMIRYLIAVGIFTTIIGCSTTLPNAEPFFKTAKELQNSGNAAFQSGEDNIKVVQKYAINKKNYDKEIKDLLEVSKARRIYLKAVVDYAHGLDRVIKSAESDINKINKVASNLDTLLVEAGNYSSAAGPYAPGLAAGAEAGRTANEIIKDLRTEIVNIKARKELNAAVEDAGNIFEKAAKVFMDDLSNLANTQKFLPSSLEANINLMPQMKYQEDLLKARNERMERIYHYGEVKKDQEKQTNFDKASSDGVWGGKHNYLVLESINKQLDWSKEISSQYEKELLDFRKKISLLEQILTETNETLDALGKAHVDLAQGIKEKKSVDFNNLFEYVKKLEKLRKQLKAIS